MEACDDVVGYVADEAAGVSRCKATPDTFTALTGRVMSLCEYPFPRKT